MGETENVLSLLTGKRESDFSKVSWFTSMMLDVYGHHFTTSLIPYLLFSSRDEWIAVT